MVVQVFIESEIQFDFNRFVSLLGMDDFVLEVAPTDGSNVWGFYRSDKSTTLFAIVGEEDGYTLHMDRLSTYDDYTLFPYLVDTLSVYLTGSPYEIDGDGAFQIFDEEWIEDCIGEEIAYLKCTLKLGYGHYISLPIADTSVCVTEDILNRYGVTIYSSTPRIYGYVNLLLKRGLLPEDDGHGGDVPQEETMVDVPQHESIGTVLSWQTDGTETTESYSVEDVKLLLRIAERYKAGESFDGVVLNDIGTIFEYAIGVNRDAEAAVYWFKEAIRQGDLLYAPTSLGDIYRRGLGDIQVDLSLALEAYRQSIDPYSWYRIGQSYEEGWVAEPDMDAAMRYYHKAASVGHHLALRRLESDDEN